MIKKTKIALVLSIIAAFMLFLSPEKIESAEGGCPTSWRNIGSWEVGCNNTRSLNNINAYMMRMTMTGGGGDDGRISYYCCGSGGSKWQANDGNWYEATDRSDALNVGNVRYTNLFGPKTVTSQYVSVGCNDGENMSISVDACEAPTATTPPTPPPAPTTPPTPPPAPTASVTGSTSGSTGQAVSYSASATGTNLTRIAIYRSPASSESWTEIASSSCNGSTCFVNGSWTPASGNTGNWYIIVNAWDQSGRKCSGNPFGRPSDWSDCGSSDYVTTTISPSSTSSCGTGPFRATGLVSTPYITTETKFNTPRGCIIDAKVSFRPFKIPSYEDLKALYFEKAKESSVVKKVIERRADAGEGVLDGHLNAGKNLIYFTGNLGMNNNLSGRRTVVVFVDGNFYMTRSDFTYGDGMSGMVFVVKGDVYFDQSVKRFDGVIISDGTIYTAASPGRPCDKNSVNTANPLTINGSLVNLNSAKPIKFCRNLDNTNPSANNRLYGAEIIIQQPKYLVILKDLYADTVQKWSEITP